MSWVDGAVLGFDTETTGVDVENDRIVTAAVVHRAGSTTSVTSWLLDPGVEIPEGAAAIHGITTEHARRHGRAPGPALDQMAGILADALLRGEPVVAFNASFDLSLLDAELRRHGLPTLPERIGRPTRVVLDPLVLDRAFDRYRKGKRKLGDLCTHYEVQAEAALHSADVDVLATLDVLRALAQRFPELAETSLDVLHDHQVGAHRRWAESFNDWRRTQGLTGPGAELTWPVRALEPVPV
jgi:DNA polymerase III subunit epsilon